MKTRSIAVGMKVKYYSSDSSGQLEKIRDGVVTGIFNDGVSENVVVEDDLYNKLEHSPHDVEIVPVKKILSVTGGYISLEVEGPGGMILR